MGERIALLFGVHAHQPAGNFPEVFEQAHARCYRPFLHTLHAYPAFRFAMHMSGPLLEYLFAQHAQDAELLVEMTRRGQIEWFGAGDCEPVLAAIPERDRIGQIEALSARLERRFGVRPQGAWLTERVWEPGVVRALADCGLRYAVVDDYHFRCAGCEAQALRGHFATEDEGRRLDLFPISEQLRYRIPFAPAEETVALLEAIAAPGEAAIYFDDIEKFGIWPETWDWVYGRRWLAEFVERVLASPRLAPLAYRDYHAKRRARGLVYLPSVSYVEMNEWTLPAEAATRYAALVRAAREAGTWEADKPFLRGGIWRNFFSRYAEANWMHKRMLALSARVAGASGRADAAALRALLYAAQANDAYWHGLFGGLYLPHLRRAVWRNLLALEARLDETAPRPAHTICDLDLDGADELFLVTAALQAVIRLDGEAAAHELSSYALAQNFGDTLRRRREHYHARLAAGAEAAPQPGGIASAHDRFVLKHAIGPADVEPDARARSLFRDSLLGAGAPETPLAGYRLVRTEGARAEFAAEAAGLRIAKTWSLEGAELRVAWRIEGGAGEFATELDLAMPSCDGFAGRFIAGGAIRGGFGEPLDLDAASGLVLDDRYLGGRVLLRVEPPARLSARPCHTVSQSEDGLERIMQSVTLRLCWPLGPEETDLAAELSVEADVEKSALPNP